MQRQRQQPTGVLLIESTRTSLTVGYYAAAAPANDRPINANLPLVDLLLQRTGSSRAHQWPAQAPTIYSVSRSRSLAIDSK